MTFYQLEVFIAVVETESFTQAGIKLNLSQSGVSHTIATLENELGIRLFQRNRTGIHVTEIGQKVLVHARAIVNRAEQLKQEAAVFLGLEVGKIRIGSFSSLSAKFLPKIVHHFREKYPQIDLAIYEGGYDEILTWLKQGQVDLGFVPLPQNGVESVSFTADHLVIVLPPHHPLKAETSLCLEQIATEPFIMPKEGCDQLVKEVFRKQQLTPNTQFEIGNTETILSMVAEGLGVTIIPQLMLPKLITDVAIAQLTPIVYRNIGLSVLSLKSAPPAVHAFITEAQQVVELINK